MTHYDRCPPPGWSLPEPVTRTVIPRPRSPWGALGYALAVIAVVAGLAFLALAIVFVTTFASMGSNK
jgi:hypothetical protein